MLTIHHLNLSQSERVIWLCKELELPYQLVTYSRAETGLAPAAYKALHPAQTSPVIEDGEVRLAETNAIFEYILTRYGNGRLVAAPGSPDYADHLFWLHYANGSFMAAGLAELVARLVTIAGVDNPAALDSLRGRWDNGFDIAERHLATRPYFGGEAFTAADILMVFPLTTMRQAWLLPRDMAPYPAIVAYLRRIAQRPAYVAAMAEADPGVVPEIP